MFVEYLTVFVRKMVETLNSWRILLFTRSIMLKSLLRKICCHSNFNFPD